MTNRVRVTLACVICTIAQCLYQVGRLKRIRSIIAQTYDNKRLTHDHSHISHRIEPEWSE